MEDSAMVSGAEENQDKKTTEESPEDEIHVRSDLDHVGGTSDGRGQSNKENGEEGPSSQTGTSESCEGSVNINTDVSTDINTDISTDGEHAKDSEVDASGNKDGGKETVPEEKKNPNEEEANGMKKDKVEKNRETAVSQKEAAINIPEKPGQEKEETTETTGQEKEETTETPGQEKEEENTETPGQEKEEENTETPGQEKEEENTETPGQEKEETTETPGQEKEETTETPGQEKEETTETPGQEKEETTETPGQEKQEEPACLTQQTANGESQTREKGQAKTTKKMNQDQQEQMKGKRGVAPPPSSVPRVSTQALSRQRSSRPSARRDALAKFQQDQTPGVRNFKVQKTSVGVSAGASIKQKILHWCSNKTRAYEGVSIENFSSSWSNGLAFCALVHRFFPSAFDFSSLKASEREKNFTLAFTTAESLAGCCPLLDVSDMLLMGNKPDPFSVFTYVQSLCQHLSKIEREQKEQREREKAEAGKSQVETEDKGSREGEEAEEEKGSVQGDVIDEETREGESRPDQEGAQTEEDSQTKMETDQNDNGVNREQATET